jgi:hypothetical protein
MGRTKKVVAAHRNAYPKRGMRGPRTDQNLAFLALRKILRRYERDLHVISDSPAEYHVDTRATAANGKPLFFGSVRPGKGVVSYTFAPASTNPELLENISPALEGRMQSKSSFTFTKPDDALFGELAALTARGYAHWKARGMI